jgi:FAD/FMN-containing dehydrogenase
MPYSANAHLSSALDLESDDVIDTAFGANLARLREIKQRYDPDNFFRVNYNIKPASQSSNFRPSSVV